MAKNNNKLKTFDEMWEDLKEDKQYGHQIRFIDMVVNTMRENSELKYQIHKKEKYLKSIMKGKYIPAAIVKQYEKLFNEEFKKIFARIKHEFIMKADPTDEELASGVWLKYKALLENILDTIEKDM